MNTKKQTCDFVRCRKVIHVCDDVKNGFCKFHFKVEKQKFILFVKQFGLADVREGINKLFYLEKDEYRKIEQKAIQIVKDNEGIIPILKESDIQFDEWWLGWIIDNKMGENKK